MSQRPPRYRYRFRSRDWLGVLLLTAIAVVIVGFLATMLGHVSVLTLERAAPDQPWNGRIESSVYGLVPLGTTPLTNVTEATVQSADDLPRSKGNAIKTYRVQFQTSLGVVSLTKFMYTGLAWHEAIRDEINEQLRDSSKKTVSLHSYDGGLWAFAPPVAFVLFASLIVWRSLRRFAASVELWPDEEVFTVE